MTPPRLPEADDPIDPALSEAAAAILDGRGLDLDSPSQSDSVRAFAAELRTVAGVAALHRSLSDDEAEARRFPPSFPWRVGTHVITGPLGRGTYGEVFRAWDDELHRDVAIKLLFAGERRGDVSARAREEGRLLARVRHPNVVTVYAVEPIDGRVGLVTEYIDGRTIAEIMRDSGPMAAAQAARIGIDLCRALAAVHGAGLLHRDIKAQNVMREAGGRVVLMDFGAGFTGAPDATALAGTPLYLAPEVIAGGAATTQSDIYSAGVLLHYLLTRAYPVTGSSLAEIRDAHARGRRQTLEQSGVGVPRALAHAIDTATQPDPRRRYASASAFADALAAAIAPHQRRRWKAAAVAVAVAATAVIAVWAAASRTRMPAADTLSESVSRVTVPAYYDFGGPSFDGRAMIHIDTRRQVWVTQIQTGQARRILEDQTSGGVAEWAILSPDAGRAAYTWVANDGRMELRVTSIDDRWPAAAQRQPAPFALMTSTAPTYLVPAAWSRDGSTLAIMRHRQDGAVDLIAAAANGTYARAVHTFTGPRPRRVSFSGDGRFITFDSPAWPSPQRDIYIVAADGAAAPTRLIGDSSNDELPMWSAAGTELIFSSDRGGASHLWRVPVRNGAVTGRPSRIAGASHALTPMAVTAAGDYYYALQTKREQLFTVPIDARGVAAGPPVAVPGDAGLSRTSPAWSPDGRTLAYFTKRGMNLYDFGGYLTFRDADGGAMRDIALPLIYFGGGLINWSPDGRRMLVRGKHIDGHFGFHRVEVQNGEISPIVRAQPQGEEINLGTSPGWGPGARTIVWTRFGHGIIERTLATGQERVIVPAGRADPITAVAPSSSGRQIAFSQTLSAAGSPMHIIAVRGEDGSIRELVRKPGRSLLLAEWTPGDDAVIYAENVGAAGWRLHRVPIGGGAPVDMNIAIEPGRLRITQHPDGRSLTYASGSTAFEVWVMRGIAR